MPWGDEDTEWSVPGIINPSSPGPLHHIEGVVVRTISGHTPGQKQNGGLVADAAAEERSWEGREGGRPNN